MTTITNYKPLNGSFKNTDLDKFIFGFWFMTIYAQVGAILAGVFIGLPILFIGLHTSVLTLNVAENIFVISLLVGFIGTYPSLFFIHSHLGWNNVFRGTKIGRHFMSLIGYTTIPFMISSALIVILIFGYLMISLIAIFTFPLSALGLVKGLALYISIFATLWYLYLN